jgi:hypothetical protein
MNADAKKTVLRMIPYGIYVLTAEDSAGNVSAATVNWVTQTAFAPPLLVVGVKTDSGAYKIIRAAKSFALNMLGKEHKSLAFTFFRPADVTDGKLSGQPYRKGTTGAPILIDATRRCRMQGHRRGRAGRPPHRGRRSSRGPSQSAASRPPRLRHPGNEGPGRQRVLRRLGRRDLRGTALLFVIAAFANVCLWARTGHGGQWQARPSLTHSRHSARYSITLLAVASRSVGRGRDLI